MIKSDPRSTAGFSLESLHPGGRTGFLYQRETSYKCPQVGLANRDINGRVCSHTAAKESVPSPMSWKHEGLPFNMHTRNSCDHFRQMVFFSPSPALASFQRFVIENLKLGDGGRGGGRTPMLSNQ